MRLGVIVINPHQLIRQILLPSNRIHLIMRIHIRILTSPHRPRRRPSRPRKRRPPQRRRHLTTPPRLHIRHRRINRRIHRIRLRRQTIMNNRLRQNQPSLRHPHLRHRMHRRNRSLQRPRISHTNLLTGRNHHPTRNKTRILTRLQHHRQIMQRSIHIRATHRLNQRTRNVIMLPTSPVIPHRRTRHRTLHMRQRNNSRITSRRIPTPRRQIIQRHPRRSLQHCQRPPRITTSHPHQMLQSIILHHKSPTQTPLIHQRRTHHTRHILIRQRRQRHHHRTRQQRRNNRKTRILRRRRHQNHRAILNPRQQSILLRLRKPMNLIKKQHRLNPIHIPIPTRSLHHRPHITHPRTQRRQLHKLALTTSHQMRKRRLPRPRRPPQNHRQRPHTTTNSALHQPPQRTPHPQHITLPTHLIQRPRPHPHRQRHRPHPIHTTTTSLSSHTKQIITHTRQAKPTPTTPPPPNPTSTRTPHNSPPYPSETPHTRRPVKYRHLGHTVVREETE